VKHSSLRKSNEIAVFPSENGTIVSEPRAQRELLRLLALTVVLTAKTNLAGLHLPRFRTTVRLRRDASGFGRSDCDRARLHETGSDHGQHRWCAHRSTPHGLRRSAVTLFHHGAHTGNSFGRADLGSQEQKS
jgi:hypothetical protein